MNSSPSQHPQQQQQQQQLPNGFANVVQQSNTEQQQPTTPLRPRRGPRINSDEYSHDMHSPLTPRQEPTIESTTINGSPTTLMITPPSNNLQSTDVRPLNLQSESSVPRADDEESKQEQTPSPPPSISSYAGIQLTPRSAARQRGQLNFNQQASPINI